MGRKKFVFLLIPVFLLAAKCESTPAPAPTVNEPSRQMVAIQPPAPTPAPTFDPKTVSQAQHDMTLEEVQRFIENLNRIIAGKNYNQWRSALSQEYFNEISSQENLKRISEQPAMKTRGIVLRNAEDYFNNVVVPSRANSRVDDIVFVGNNRVQAFTVNTNRAGEEQRLRLYDLEKIGNAWKIIN